MLISWRKYNNYITYEYHSRLHTFQYGSSSKNSLSAVRWNNGKDATNPTAIYI